MNRMDEARGRLLALRAEAVERLASLTGDYDSIVAASARSHIPQSRLASE